MNYFEILDTIMTTCHTFKDQNYYYPIFFFVARILDEISRSGCLYRGSQQVRLR